MLSTIIEAELGILFIILIYVYVSYTFMTLGKKLKLKKLWMAWVPVIQYYFMCKLGKKPGWWIIFFILPGIYQVFTSSLIIEFIISIAYIFVMISVWMKITERRKINKWWGLLSVVPFVNLVFMGYLAYSKK